MKKLWWVAAAYLLATAAVTVVGLRNPFVLDDYAKVIENPDIRSLEDFPQKLIYPYEGGQPKRYRNDPSRPAVFLTYTLNYHFSGVDPVGYHLFDAFCHFLLAFLVYLFSKRLLGLVFGAEKRGWAFALGLVFVCHPITVGTAMYVYGRSDVLAALFSMASLFVLYRKDTPSIAGMISSFLFFALALASKESAAVLPGVLFLFDLLILGKKSWPEIRRRLKLYFSFAGLAAAAFIARQVFLGGVGNVDVDQESLWRPLEYLSYQPYVILRYFFLFLIPWGLSLDHVYYPESIGAGLRLAALVPWMLLTFYLWKRYRSWTAHGRIEVFGLAFFFLLIVPTSSIIPTSDVMVERRVYLACGGFFLALVALIDSRLSGRRSWFKKNARFLIGAFVAILVAVSISRLRTANTEIGAWENVYQQYPDNERAIANLARLYGYAGDEAKAFQMYDVLFKRFPGHFQGYNNLGAYFFRKRNYEQAEANFRRALALQPDYAPAIENMSKLTTVLAEKGRPTPAGPPNQDVLLRQNADSIVQMYRDRLGTTPQDLNLRKKFAEFLERVSRREQAIEELGKVLELEPDDQEARGQLEALLRQGPSRP